MNSFIALCLFSAMPSFTAWLSMNYWINGQKHDAAIWATATIFATLYAIGVYAFCLINEMKEARQ
jgi:hypothetical protein